ncbi:hypothetical protein DICVIV_07657 [Dictyocaulus viviparus]|uniref:N-acetyllactosaminide beta-1,3-N-acetylglucosaminyltransferase n=1 Tax=Dictyocaulus viviparus TaxID=29172 RepID=A0A0D8XP29_DICVI|nr:hypothetical protein DICVIV_07657 [Dictyocaulus viviparus]
MRKIRTISAEVARYLRVHIVFTNTWSVNCSIPSAIPSASSSFECKKSNRYDIKQIAHYPANLARNIARLFSASKYIVITDYEHLFSKGFEETVRAIASVRLAEKPQTMLVYRIFEVDKRVKRLPQNKADLGKLYRSGNAVIFHAWYYPGAHEIDGLSMWFKKKRTDDGIFMKDFKYDRSNWEPQFVSHWQIPFHDENFPFQLRDNTVLRWEMCRANYTIDILDNVFVFHRGIKQPSIYSHIRAVQKRNIARYKSALDLFKQRMDSEYPETKERCPSVKY